MLFGTTQGLRTMEYRFYHGDRSGFAGSAEKNDRFGYALATGDFNNDNVDELVVFRTRIWVQAEITMMEMCSC